MAQVEVSINGRNYQIACDDGQEGHLVQLGEYVDRRVKELVTAVDAAAARIEAATAGLTAPVPAAE